MDVMKRAWTYVQRMWERLGLPQRVALGSLSALFVFITVFLATSTGQENMFRLIDTTDQEAYTSVFEALKAQGYQYYEQRPDGLYARLKDKYELGPVVLPIINKDDRIKLLTEMGLTSSQWSMEKALQIMEEKYIVRMIQASLPEAKAISVKVTPLSGPRKYDFKGPSATAAVTIRMKPNAEFKEGNARSVAGLIAASVYGLKPEDVVVIVDGVDRRIRPAGSDVEVAVDLLDIKKRWDEYYLEKLHTFMPEVVAQVDVRIKNRKQRTHEEKYDENPRDYELRKSESSSKGGAAAQSPSIKAAGTLDLRAEPSANEAHEEESAETEKKTLYGSTTTDTEFPWGDLDEIRASVLFPLYDVDMAGVQQRSAEIPQWKEKVANILGTTVDKVAFDFIPASKPEEVVVAATWDGLNDFMGEWGGTVFLWSLALVGLLMLFLILRKAVPRDVVREMDKLRERMAEDEQKVEEERLKTTLAIEEAKKKAAEEVVIEEPEPEPVVELPEEERKIIEMKDTIKVAAEKNPRGMAGLLKRWMVESR